MASGIYTGIFNLYNPLDNILPPNHQHRIKIQTLDTTDNMKWPLLSKEEINLAKQAQAIIHSLQQELNIALKCNKAETFGQLEKSPGGIYHCHYAFNTNTLTGRDARMILDNAGKRANNIYFGGKNITWFRPLKTKNGAWKQQTKSFITEYLLIKLPLKECTYAWNTFEDQDIQKKTLNIDERKKNQNTEDTTTPPDTPPIHRQNSGKLLRKTTEFLVNNNITTERKWLQQFPDSYYSFAASSQGMHITRKALETANIIISQSKPLILSLTKFNTNTELDNWAKVQQLTEIKNNPLWELFITQKYDPRCITLLLYWWANRQTGKRNCIWLHGPPSTGKTLLASAIANASASFGMVNWNNQNFPFQDLLNKQLGWWEEGSISAEIVESAKAIMGGTPIRIDRKCTTSAPLHPPPLIITSNTDITVVKSGSTIDFSHTEALMARIIKLPFTETLPPTYPHVTEQHIQQIFRLGAILQNAEEMPPVMKRGPLGIPHVFPYGTGYPWRFGTPDPIVGETLQPIEEETANPRKRRSPEPTPERIKHPRKQTLTPKDDGMYFVPLLQIMGLRWKPSYAYILQEAWFEEYLLFIAAKICPLTGPIAPDHDPLQLPLQQLIEEVQNEDPDDIPPPLEGEPGDPDLEEDMPRQDPEATPPLEDYMFLEEVNWADDDWTSEQ
nr:MAG: replicase [Ovine copiparvovirus]